MFHTTERGGLKSNHLRRGWGGDTMDVGRGLGGYDGAGSPAPSMGGFLGSRTLQPCIALGPQPLCGLTRTLLARSTDSKQSVSLQLQSKSFEASRFWDATSQPLYKPNSNLNPEA